MTEVLAEGWYLMSVEDLELELRRWRTRDPNLPSSNARRLSTTDALVYRNAGNLPDEHGRTLRLVLEVRDADDLRNLDDKRLHYEPDFHDAPGWRREGSRPINVVPLRDLEQVPGDARPWFEDPELGALEREWQRTGTIAGVAVPADYRGFVYKTVLALRRAGREVSAESIAASVARWLDEPHLSKLRRALLGGSS